MQIFFKMRVKKIVLLNPPYMRPAEQTHSGDFRRASYVPSLDSSCSLYGMELKQQVQQRDKTLMSLSALSGLDSDESYEGVSESSFKDALVFDGSSQKNNGSVPQQNGIKKHRSGRIPPLFICAFVRIVQFHEA